MPPADASAISNTIRDGTLLRTTKGLKAEEIGTAWLHPTRGLVL